ncbi:MAG: STAS domain-containing protein [bacterium]|nr:STAS domain-containing protein [bacterium]
MEITENIIDNIFILSLNGKLDTITSNDLQEKLMDTISSGEKKIIIDLTECSYISSAGLRVLLMGQKRLKPLGGSIMLASVSDNIKQIFSISGFSSLFVFFDSIDAALQK